MQDSFAKYVYWRADHLKSTSLRNDPLIASKVAKLIEKLRSKLKEMNFDEVDNISIFTFFYSALKHALVLEFKNE